MFYISNVMSIIQLHVADDIMMVTMTTGLLFHNLLENLQFEV